MSPEDQVSTVSSGQPVDSHNSPEGMDRFWANVPPGYFEDRAPFYKMVAEYCRDTHPGLVKSVLDVGCSGGLMLKAIDDLVVVTQRIMVGLDFSVEGLRLAKKNFPDALYVLGDITDPVWWNIDLGFDLILCTQTLEHIRNYDVALRHMAGLTSHYGEVVITVPDGEQDLFPLHVNRWSFNQFQALMRKHGGVAYRMGSMHLIGVI